MGRGRSETHVVVVGGGFAGLGCVRRLIEDRRVRVTLIDRNPYHQFQPLLYQVATAQLAAADVAPRLDRLLRRHDRAVVRRAEVAAVDPLARSVTTTDGERIAGDVLVLAAGSRAAPPRADGAEAHAIPLYTLDDAGRLRDRVVGRYREAAAAGTVRDGELTFVVAGGGATGVETAGALAEMCRGALRVEFPGVDPAGSRVVLVGHGPRLLKGFADHSGGYAAEVLRDRGVEVRLGVGVEEVGPGHVRLGDGTRIDTRCVVWAGGVRASGVAVGCGLPLGRGGRVDVRPDLTVPGFPGVLVAGDLANIPGPDGRPLPQLGAVALQAGRSAADAVLRGLDGAAPEPFRYHDKGMMAMIARGAAVAEVGHGRHVVRGRPAFAAWLAVHAALMSGVRERADAFVRWAWEALAPSHRAPGLHLSEEGRIDWDEEAGRSDDPGA